MSNRSLAFKPIILADRLLPIKLPFLKHVARQGCRTGTYNRAEQTTPKTDQSICTSTSTESEANKNRDICDSIHQPPI